MYSTIMDAMLAQARTAAMGAVGNNPDPGIQRILDRHMARMLAEMERVLTARSPVLFAAFARGHSARNQLGTVVAAAAAAADLTNERRPTRNFIELIL